MKRGLITWDKLEQAPAMFESRLRKVRDVLSAKQLPALVVYSELWRSNEGRYFSNYMPYFNRALLILPVEQPPILLCGLSPRVYSWIKSVTVLEDIRPGGNFARPLFQLASERQWTKVGVLGLRRLPYDIYNALHGGPVELVDIEAGPVFAPVDDGSELLMRRKAFAIAKDVLRDELVKGVRTVDHRFVGRLERRFRRAGAEDLIVLLTNGEDPPAPPSGKVLEESYSVSVALEYRGHWIRLSRPRAPAEMLEGMRIHFKECLRDSAGIKPAATGSPKRVGPLVGAGFMPALHALEDLGGSYPYECADPTSFTLGSFFALHLQFNLGGKRLFYGDTCWYGASGPEAL